jgi:S-(hydroxymethyl)glutathione dehydrogenase/alcohol dehydrogenase
MKVNAAVLYEAGAPLVVDQVDLGGPGPGEVLVRVAVCGVCHSDLHIIQGEWAGFDVPIVVGHEAAGVVEAAGEGVTSVAPGDHVVLGWKSHCGRCPQCANERPHLCSDPPLLVETSSLSRDGQTIGRMLTSSYLAEYAVVPWSVAIPIHKEMPLDRAALLGCAVMTGVGAAMNTAQVKPGTTVAVFGCGGGVGVNVAQGAALCGAARVIGVDVAADKLAYARHFGLTDTVNAAETDPVAAILELTGGQGVDAAFDAVGSARVVEQAFASLCIAGMAVIVGMPAFRETIHLSLPLMPFYRERWVTGSYYGGLAAAHALLSRALGDRVLLWRGEPVAGHSPPGGSLHAGQAGTGSPGRAPLCPGAGQRGVC